MNRITRSITPFVPFVRLVVLNCSVIHEKVLEWRANEHVHFCEMLVQILNGNEA